MPVYQAPLADMRFVAHDIWHLIGDPFYYYSGTGDEYVTGADDAGQQAGAGRRAA